MSRVITLAVMVGFFGMILVVVQDPFRNHSTPYSLGLELALATTCRAFGALIAIVTGIELLLRVSSGREITNISNWIVVLLAALCLFTPTWTAPLGLSIIAVALILASGFGRANGRPSEKATTGQQLSEDSSDFKDWEQS